MTNTIDIYVDGSAINNENPNVPTLGGVGVFIDLSKSPEDENAKGSYGIFVGHIKDHKLEDDGDYTGDVDVQVLQLAEEGTLCVNMATDSDVIFDVLLFPLDGCDLPGQPLNAASGYPLGIDSQNGTGHWEQELSPGTYAVQAAAWRPDDEARLVPYEITLALMPSNPNDLVHCPSVLEKS